MAKQNRLNTVIGLTSRLNNQLVGLQISNGTFFAIMLSVIQVSGGFGIAFWPQLHTWFADKNSTGGIQLQFVVPIEVAVVLLGIVVSILIERFTIGGLKKRYAANKQLATLEDEYEKSLEDESLTPEQRENIDKLYQRRTKRHKKNKASSKWPILLGTLFSTVLGHFFWSVIFSGFGEIGGFIMAGLLAFIIPFTFADTELGRDSQVEALKESVNDTELLEEVLKSEGKSIQLEVVAEAIENVRNDPDKRAEALGKVEEKFVESLPGIITMLRLGAPKTEVQELDTATTHQGESQEPEVVEGEYTETPEPLQVKQGHSNVSIQLPKFSVAGATRIPDDPQSDEQIALQVIRLDAFSMKLYKHVAHVQALRTSIFEIIEAYQNWQDSVPEVAEALRLEAPDVAEEITDERVTAIVDKMVHEMDTEPLDTPKPRPLGEMLGLNTKEDYRRAINTALGYVGYTLRETDEQDVVDAESEQESEQQVNISASNVSRAVSPATNQSRPRRQYRKVTGVQGSPRSKMDAKMTRKLERILNDDPEISNNQLGAQLGVSPNTAKRYREMLTNQQA